MTQRGFGLHYTVSQRWGSHLHTHQVQWLRNHTHTTFTDKHWGRSMWLQWLHQMIILVRCFNISMEQNDYHVLCGTSENTIVKIWYYHGKCPKPTYYNSTCQKKNKKNSISSKHIQKTRYYCGKYSKPLHYNCTCTKKKKNHDTTVVNA